MTSNEPSSIGDTIGGENSSNQITEPVQSITSPTTANSSLNPRSAAYRAVHFAAAANDESNAEDEENWWNEAETQNFTLDHVPNVTSVFTPSLEDVINKPPRQEETYAMDHDADFDRLHRLTDRIKSTINEQRERHLSESSEKSLTDCGKQDMVQDPQESVAEIPYKEQSLEEFKEELREKRLARQTAIQSFREEIATLRKQLEKEREISKRLRNGENVESLPEEEEPQNKTSALNLENHKKEPLSLKEPTPEGACALQHTSSCSDEDDEDPLSRSRHANIELANAQLSLQLANSENFTLRGELAGVQKHVGTLKEVVACCKQMLSVKEEQCNQFRKQLMQYEKEHQQQQPQQQQQQEHEKQQQLPQLQQLQHLNSHPRDTNCCCNCHMPDPNNQLL